MKFTEFEDGIVIQGDCLDQEVREFVSTYMGEKKFALFNFDPPYFIDIKSLNSSKIEEWDRSNIPQQQAVNWMFDWTKFWWDMLEDRGAYYCWGGIGKNKMRPFYQYLLESENRTDMNMFLADHITWQKKRAFGKQKGYLFQREEILYFLKSTKNDPRVFNIPLTDNLRGYSGFSSKYKAKSDYLRRGNVWNQTELFQKKRHSCEKVARVIEIPIETNTNPGEWVLDIFAGCGVTGEACRKLGRKFVLIDSDPKCYELMLTALGQI